MDRSFRWPSGQSRPETPPTWSNFVAKVTGEVQRRFNELTEARRNADEGIDQARAFVESSLGLQVWAHRLYLTAESSAHGDDPETRDEEDGHSH